MTCSRKLQPPSQTQTPHRSQHSRTMSENISVWYYSRLMVEFRGRGGPLRSSVSLLPRCAAASRSWGWHSLVLTDLFHTLRVRKQSSTSSIINQFLMKFRPAVVSDNSRFQTKHRAWSRCFTIKTLQYQHSYCLPETILTIRYKLFNWTSWNNWLILVRELQLKLSSVCRLSIHWAIALSHT